jgi:hypothetical protein
MCAIVRTIEGNIFSREHYKEHNMTRIASVFFLFCMTLLGCSVVVTPPPEETEETEPEPQPQRFEVRAKALPRDLAVPGQVKAFGLYEVENTTTVEVCVTSIELARVGALNGIVTAAATFSTGKGGPAQHALDGTSAQIDVEGDGCVPSGESKTFSVTGTVGQIDPGTGSVQSGDTIGILLTNVTASASEDVEVTLLDGQDVEVASLSGVQHVLRRARPVVSVYPVDSTVVDGEFEAYRFAISADSVGGPVGLASFALEMPSAAVDGMPTRLRRYDATVQQDVDMSATMTVLADTPQAGTSTVLVRFGELVLNPDPNESTILSLRWSSASGGTHAPVPLAFAYHAVLATATLACGNPTKVLTGVEALPGIAWTDLPGADACTSPSFTGDGLVSGVVR